MREQDSLSHVVDMHHVQAELRERLRRHLAGAGLLDHLPEERVVAGPIHAPGLHDDDRSAPRGALLGELMREVLGLVVVGHEPVRFVALEGLVDRPPVRVPERVHSRDVDEPFHAGILGGIEHAFRTADVRVVHRLALRRRHPDAVVGGDVEGRLAALHASTNGVSVAEVALNDLRVEPCGLLRRAHEHHYVVAAVAQPLDDARADEARSARHEPSHGPADYP
jgi:hypothetical protein